MLRPAELACLHIVYAYTGHTRARLLRDLDVVFGPQPSIADHLRAMTERQLEITALHLYAALIEQRRAWRFARARRITPRRARLVIG